MAGTNPSTGPVAATVTLPMTPYGPGDVYAQWAAAAHRIIAGGEVGDDHYLKPLEVRHGIEAQVTAMQEEIRRKNLEINLNYYLKQRDLDMADRLDQLRMLYDFGGSTDDFVQEFILVVQTDADRGMKYIVLPDSFLNVRKWQRLPGDEGIKDIVPLRYVDRAKFEFVPMRAGQDTLFMGTFQGGLGTLIGFYRMQDRGYFVTEPTCSKFTLEKVIARLVIRDKNDDRMPPAPTYGAVLESVVVAATVAAFQRRAEEDQRNDNSSAVRP